MRFDVVIVGAGPAGIAAASAASESGAQVGVIDDNPAAGGQIWRNEPNAWTRNSKATLLTQHRVVDQPAPGTLLAVTGGGSVEVSYEKLIIATGARERFVPFPGWTLPGVMGAGGLQAMVKGGMPVAGKRVVVAGSGPLLLAVAAYLRKRGANITLIAEQAEFRRVASFGLSLWNNPEKLGQAIGLQWELRGIRHRYAAWPVRAEGDGRLQSLTLNEGAEACDYLACGFGLVPNIELPMLLGCRFENGFVQVDELQQTTVANVYCAGEPTGIGGVDLALLQGRIAGYAATGQHGRAGESFAARAKCESFRRQLDDAFALRDELRSIAQDDTIVCRCEDVTLRQIRQQDGWRAAKLHTRCGMGPCQGRICGPAVESLLGWTPESVRPPLFPATIGQILGQ